VLDKTFIISTSIYTTTY